MSFGIPEKREGCSQHGRIEDLVASNNTFGSSLAGQMKVLFWILGGCGIIISGAITAGISNTIKTDRLIANTLNGISQNRHAINDVKVVALENQKRIIYVESAIVSKKGK